MAALPRRLQFDTNNYLTQITYQDSEYKFLPFKWRLPQFCCWNTLFTRSYPENGSIVALVPVQLVVKNTVGTPGHGLGEII